jgi:hypothetical protein
LEENNSENLLLRFLPNLQEGCFSVKKEINPNIDGHPEVDEPSVKNRMDDLDGHLIHDRIDGAGHGGNESEKIRER